MAFHSRIFDALTAEAPAEWSAYTRHAFVRQLADGSLPEACFLHYLKQDYVFLLNYARAYALAVVKSQHLDDLRQNASAVDLLLNGEIALHVSYCAEWGLSEADLAATEEAPANRLYTRYVMDCGQTGDLLDLLVALAPCAFGYAVIGADLMADPATKLDGNPYRPWIEMYGTGEYQEGMAPLAEMLDRVAARRGLQGDGHQRSFHQNSRWPSLVETFRTATALEVDFWEMGLNPPEGV